jgi:putative transcriptional regulator
VVCGGGSEDRDAVGVAPDGRVGMKAKMKIENRVRRLRFDHGEMTQQALAEKVGATRQTVLAIEAGKYAPSLELAFRIADAFGVGVQEVFQREYEEQP